MNLSHEQSGSRRAVILRGIPGSGKSTVAAALAQASGLPVDECTFSTDRLFEVFNGGEFAQELLPRLHQINLTRFIEAAAASMPLIVCDNTNIEPWQFAAYKAAARALGYEVEIRVVGNPFDAKEVERCAARNVHRVPAEVVRDMATRLAGTLDSLERGHGETDDLEHPMGPGCRTSGWSTERLGHGVQGHPGVVPGCGVPAGSLPPLSGHDGQRRRSMLPTCRNARGI